MSFDQISEQHNRARPSIHQTTGQGGAGVLLIPNGLANLAGLRDDAYDPEGASSSRWSPGPSQVRQQPVWAGCLTRLIQGSPNPFTKLVRFFATEPPPIPLWRRRRIGKGGTGGCPHRGRGEAGPRGVVVR